jgi:hypothetical protein
MLDEGWVSIHDVASYTSVAFPPNASAQARPAEDVAQTTRRNPALPEADGSPNDEQILRVDRL